MAFEAEAPGSGLSRRAEESETQICVGRKNRLNVAQHVRVPLLKVLGYVAAVAIVI